jgi:hypothetical protein
MPEPQLPPSWDGSVVLEIGGEVGALVLRTPPTLDGREIDLVPDDPAIPVTHSAVRQRRLTQSVSYAAVYPNLVDGDYRVEGTGQRVTITGGRVTDVDLDVTHLAPVHAPLRQQPDRERRTSCS